MTSFFHLQEADWQHYHQQQQQEQKEEEGEGGEELEGGGETEEERRDRLERSAEHGRRLVEEYGLVLRSKGFGWVLGRDAHMGEWGQAGGILSFSTGEWQGGGGFRGRVRGREEGRRVLGGGCISDKTSGLVR
jgi:G3E family GTPase